MNRLQAPAAALGMRGRGMAAALATALLALLAVSVLTAEQARAQQDLEVTTTADGNDECEADDCTLREAVLEANADPGEAATITLPGPEPGEATATYVLDIDPGANRDLGESGDLVIAGDGPEAVSDVTIVGTGADEVVIDASAIDDRVFRVGSLRGRVLGQLTLEGVTVTGGSEVDNGGGIAVLDGSSATLEDVAVTGNAATNGGGIHAQGGEDPSATQVEVARSLIADNDAGNVGGGLFLDRASVSLENTTISGNSAITGGGIEHQSENAGSGTLDLLHVTLADNEAFEAWPAVGGAGGTAEATIVADNVDGRAMGDSCATPFDSNGDNLEDGDSCGFDAASDQPDTDPALATLFSNPPGSTRTHALPATSPAVDAIDDCAVATDQRGVSRPQDGSGDGDAACDVGAYERTAPGLDVAKDAPASVLVGEDFDYVIEVTNPSESAVGVVSLTDTLPDEVDFVEVDPAGACDYDEPSGELTCDLGDLAAGETETVTVTVTATTPTSSASNLAVASSLEPDLTAEDSASVLISTENPCPPEGFPEGLERLEGRDRFETAIEVSRACFDEADAVVLTRSDIFPDALSGTPLAVDLGAPLLFTQPGTLNAQTAAEIDNLLDPGDDVYLLGETVALSQDVEDAVENAGYNAVRLGGANRFETAAIIADEGLGDPSTLLLSTGRDFPDPLAGAAGEAVAGAVLLTDDDVMAPETQAYLDGRTDDPDLFAVGGPAAAAAPDATPVFGADRYATSVEVAEEFFAAPNSVGIATGGDFPDALSGGVHMGKQGGPMLLTRTATLPEVVETYLEDNAATIDWVWIFGGTNAVSQEVEDAANATVFQVGP